MKTTKFCSVSGVESGGPGAEPGATRLDAAAAAAGAAAAGGRHRPRGRREARRARLLPHPVLQLRDPEQHPGA